MFDVTSENIFLMFTKTDTMNTVGYFEIQAKDVKAALQFYQTVFGWHFTKHDWVPIEYYEIETGGIRGGLLQRPTPVPPLGTPTNAFVCSVQVDDLDKVSGLILSNGGQVAMHKFAVPGRCWQGYFLDADNNTFGIFQADENAG